MKTLFAEGTIPAASKVTESTVTSKGVIIVKYEPPTLSQPELNKDWPGGPGLKLYRKQSDLESRVGVVGFCPGQSPALCPVGSLQEACQE